MNIFSAIFSSPVGKLGIQTHKNKLIQIKFLSNRYKIISPKTNFDKKVVYQLKQYFKNPKFQFNLVINLQGTPLQKQIWRELLKIPAGYTYFYSDLAKKFKTHPRIIGNACRANLIPIIIPCHRIIGKNNLGGYCGQKIGQLLNKKTFLLRHETIF